MQAFDFYKDHKKNNYCTHEYTKWQIWYYEEKTKLSRLVQQKTNTTRKSCRLKEKHFLLPVQAEE
ncbi:hypothetical protein FHR28_001358 [Acinetobacter sp. BIGb0196]|nr:hypothetical protein [Acinetobacter guillouiae]MCW2253643.1 hypothetical protein [Acinetobacter sp. BIGb0204]NII36449.1 hypothetical protein [Acinetobacter sp. BIGb0196]